MVVVTGVVLSVYGCDVELYVNIEGVQWHCEEVVKLVAVGKI